MVRGKWVIVYNPGEYNYTDILDALPNVRDSLNENQRKAPYKKIFFKKKKDGFSIETGDSLPHSININPGHIDIKNILLAYPVLMSDKRWETIHLTSSSLILGSTLTTAGFNVSTRKLVTPGTAIDDTITTSDMLGLTLFEDLFKEAEEFLIKLSKTTFSGLLAAGGPMVTLNPLQSTRHLPQLNLLVRGEAEFILPRLLNAVTADNLSALLEFKGFLYQVPGTVILSDLDVINRPDWSADFSGFRFNTDFLEKKHLDNGLEINLSRGCGRSCVFCSHVQGRQLRQLPPEIFHRLLSDVSAKIDTMEIQSPQTRTVNINDDDILQDPEYARTVFRVTRDTNFKLWGIQTSVNSFFKKDRTIDTKLLDIAADKSLYVNDNPLTWIGTDAFLRERGKRLGKQIPGEPQIRKLLEAFEKRDIRNYHYWISSDHDSDWDEFTREFLFIYRLFTGYKTFGLIAHSPFLVPYSTAPVYKHLVKSPERANRVKYRRVLHTGNEIFRFPLVERVETAFPQLNRLLRNEKLANRLGFFDYLKQNDYLNAFITLYNFLKLERLAHEPAESAPGEKSGQLSRTEKKIEAFISEII